MDAVETAVILASGGINSTVAACRALKTCGAAHLLWIDFGQRCGRGQQQAVAAIAKKIGAKHSSLSLTAIGQPILGRGAGDAKIGDPPATAVVRRSPASDVLCLQAIMLSAAVQLAQRIGASSVHTGASEAADEYETESAPGKGTPDHRREFFYLFNVMLEQLQVPKVRIALQTPLIDLGRDEIIRLGARFDAPYELTYSCKSEPERPCGSCPSCTARQKAFKLAGLEDPAFAAVEAA